MTDITHEERVPSGSHYIAPGAFVGQDGTTHLAAMGRLGYNRAKSVTNQTYDDIVELYGQGKRSVTTTFFTTNFLRAADIENDPRLQLFPPFGNTDVFDGLTSRADLREALTGNTEVRMTMKNGELFTIDDLVEPFSHEASVDERRLETRETH